MEQDFNHLRCARLIAAALDDLGPHRRYRPRGCQMSPAQHVAAITKRIEARIAKEPDAQRDYFALSNAGREAVRRILEDELPREMRHD